MRGGFENAFVRLEPVEEANVARLVDWMLDSTARGPHRAPPTLDGKTLRRRMLRSDVGSYFLLRRAPDGAALGWVWWRPWRFEARGASVDWQIDAHVVEPALRGFGFELAAYLLGGDHLLTRPGVASVFALTHLDDVPQQRSLRQAGFSFLGRWPLADYPVPPPGIPSLIYARRREEVAEGSLGDGAR